MTALRLYTDGSCYPPGTVGGWAWILVSEHPVASGSSKTPGPSNHQRCEVTAAIEGLTFLVASRIREVELLSDSRHVVGGMSSTGCKGCKGWAHPAAKRGWRDARGKPLKILTSGSGSSNWRAASRHLATRARPPAEDRNERRRPLQPRGRCNGTGGPLGALVGGKDISVSPSARWAGPIPRSKRESHR